MGFPVLDELLVVDFLELLGLLFVLVVGDDLLFEFVRVLLQKCFSFLFELLFDLLQLFLLPDSCFELSLLGLCLLFQSPFFFDLLLDPGFLQFLRLLVPNFGFGSVLFSGGSLVCLDSPFGPQRVELCLPVGGFLLQFSEPLDFLLFFLFDASE